MRLVGTSRTINLMIQRRVVPTSRHHHEYLNRCKQYQPVDTPRTIKFDNIKTRCTHKSSPSQKSEQMRVRLAQQGHLLFNLCDFLYTDWFIDIDILISTLCTNAKITDHVYIYIYIYVHYYISHLLYRVHILCSRYSKTFIVPFTAEKLQMHEYESRAYIVKREVKSRVDRIARIKF